MTKQEHDALYEEYCQDPQKVKKYKKPGIYCIKINGQIVYVGKSTDMLNRIAGHSLEIMEGTNGNKYKVLNQAFQREDCKIEFDVLYKSRKRNPDTIFEDIGEAEAKYINELRPALNYQIPTIGDYKHYTVNRRAKFITLAEILDPSAEVFIF